MRIYISLQLVAHYSVWHGLVNKEKSSYLAPSKGNFYKTQWYQNDPIDVNFHMKKNPPVPNKVNPVWDYGTQIPGGLHTVFTHIVSAETILLVHGILFFLQTHVPGYMILCFFFKSMYPGTWNFDFSSNPCTPVHEIWILFHYLCVAQGVEVARCKKYFFFCQIFSTCEKIIQFLKFCKDQDGKI